MTDGPAVLVVDDEELIRWSLAEELRSEGYHPVEAGSLEEARTLAAKEHLELCIFDVRLPDGSGVDLLREFRERDADLPIVMITGHGNVALAVEVTRLGATEYIPKPFDLTEMMLAVERATKSSRRARELRALRARSARGYGSMIGESPAMMRVFDLLSRLEDADAPTVLILGESGTGKDLVARAIHARSKRRDEPFLEVDCTGLSDTLMNSELFGHERGSFTDAKTRKLGLFEVAGKGTIFLDEIGELSLQTQGRLLRALENRKFKRVGGTTDIEVKARVVAATNRDLAAEVEAGRFRQDLYYRLAVIPVEVPALRDRHGDAALLVQHFVRELSRDLGRPLTGIEPNALARLDGYDWPGNVRELRNVVERAVILSRGPTITVADLPPELSGGRTGGHSLSGGPFRLPDEGINLAEMEHDLVLQALERTDNNQSAAARLLGIGRYALRYRMEKLGLLKKGSATEEGALAEA
ncbi:MAG: sigma-54-dependent Fis family transcriptional regulator [Proteobacteria bacterium]|nr:sigma-54-dependent Fis family transcriptional regulator [Pseudomonadota bacterium]